PWSRARTRTSTGCSRSPRTRRSRLRGWVAPAATPSASTGCSPSRWRSCGTRTSAPCRRCSAEQPALMRAQRFDLRAVRDAMSAQHALVDAVVAEMPPGHLARPTRLGDWTIAELVAHLGRDMAAVTRYLGQAPAPRAEIDAADYVLAAASAAARVDEEVRAMTDEARPAELRSFVHGARLSADDAVA